MKTASKLAHLTVGSVKEKVSLRHYVDEKPKYFFFKRLFDIAFSLVMILGVLSWLIPIVALLVKIDSKGSVFFIQRRVGKGGRIFRCFKFRTMVMNADANYVQAQRNDPRITRIGSFLRFTNLDEFPQFFNVLAGDMSVV